MGAHHSTQAQSTTSQQGISASSPSGGAEVNPEASQPIYTSQHTGAQHEYTIGENVILIGEAELKAQQQGLVNVGKIVFLYDDPTTGEASAELELFQPGISANQQEASIGQLYGTIRVVLAENVRPFPFYLRQIPIETLKQEVTKETCRTFKPSDIWGCSSCDTSGKLFEPSEFFATRENVMETLTKVQGGVGDIRFTIFTCPDRINRQGEAISGSNSQCKEVIIATTHKNDNTNRYSLVASPSKLTVQQGFLKAYGLPTTETMLWSVPWSEVPNFNQLTEEMETQRIVCKDVDNTWLYENVQQLLQRGYTVSSP